MRPFFVPAKQRSNAEHNHTRHQSPRLLCLALVAAFFFIGIVGAQQPRAVVTGPKEARCGSLIVLDASESTGVGRMWLLAVSPEETSFLPVESGLKCIFASPVAGAYRFVLVVSGTNSNGGPAADMATHTVLLSGGTIPPPQPPPVNPPPVTPPPDPTTPPMTSGVAYLVIVRSNQFLTADQAAVILQLRQWSDARPEKVSQLEISPDAGADDDRLSGYITAAKSLPWTIVSQARTDGKGAAVIWSGPLPARAEDLQVKVLEVIQ